MFISDDGDVNFGGPGGEPAKEAAPPKNPTHNVKLPPSKTKLTMSVADKALREMGFKLGRGNTDLKKKETTYEVTKPDGTTTKMTTDDIKKLVYDGTKARAKKKTQPKANKDFDESKITRDDDGKFGGGGGKSTNAKSADLALPEPKMKVSAKSARQMEEMIQGDLEQGKTLEESFAEYDDGGWDYLEFAGEKNAIANVEKALDKHDDKSGNEQGTTDEIDGQHWEDWVSDNYTGPVQQKLIDEFKKKMAEKFGKKS